MLINQANFLLTEIPNYHPLSDRYVEWWRVQKKKCIEGEWVGGMWMPPNLYFYTNFGTIMLNKNINSKVKSKGRPFLRDLEWEFFYLWAEARGFSGFSDDKLYTCNRILEKPDSNLHSLGYLQDKYPNIFLNNDPTTGLFKTYQPARDYLRKIHAGNMGRPLRENEARDFMMMGSRGFGKSYGVGVGIVAHGFLFDEQTQYIPGAIITEEESIEILVGAGEAKYSNDLLAKARLTLENLPGSQEIDNKFYPSPLFKMMKGSWGVDKDIEHRYRKKMGNNWVWKGTGSKIKHRTFKNNPFASNGTRSSIAVFEEVGMFSNLLDSRNAAVETQMNGSIKYGSMMFLGTGGDMGSGTKDSLKMFSDPETYNLLTFNDDWENSGKIAYFVPAYLGLNEYKKETVKLRLYEGTDVEAAKIYLERHREKLRKGKSNSAIDAELQNRPLTTSEMFLTKKGNVFPVDELRRQLVKVQTTNASNLLRSIGSLVFDNDSQTGVKFVPDFSRQFEPIDDYPIVFKDNTEGALVIYEHPIYNDEGNIPPGAYYIGHDPVANDEGT